MSMSCWLLHTCLHLQNSNVYDVLLRITPQGICNGKQGKDICFLVFLTMNEEPKARLVAFMHLRTPHVKQTTVS